MNERLGICGFLGTRSMEGIVQQSAKNNMSFDELVGKCNKVWQGTFPVKQVGFFVISDVTDQDIRDFTEAQ